MPRKGENVNLEPVTKILDFNRFSLRQVMKGGKRVRKAFRGFLNLRNSDLVS